MDNGSDIPAIEPMKTALVRTVLAGLPRVSLGGPTDGMVAILRRDVLRAGLDPLDVLEWIGAVGGAEGETYVRAPRGAQGPGGCRTAVQPESYYALPSEALDAPTAPAT